LITWGLSLNTEPGSGGMLWCWGCELYFTFFKTWQNIQ
jgi:hypothetical protein